MYGPLHRSIIIDSKEVHLTSSINFQYKMLLIKIGGEELIQSNFTTQKLEIKLLEENKGKTRRGNILFSSSQLWKMFSGERLK